MKQDHNQLVGGEKTYIVFGSRQCWRQAAVV